MTINSTMNKENVLHPYLLYRYPLLSESRTFLMKLKWRKVKNIPPLSKTLCDVTLLHLYSNGFFCSENRYLGRGFVKVKCPNANFLKAIPVEQ